MLFLFPFPSLSCDYSIFPDLGITHHSFSTSDGAIICMNFSVYPIFLIFNTYSSDTLYHEYSAQLENEPLKEQFYTEIRFLDVFRAIISPYSAISIHTPTGCNLIFSTAVLPGMCSEGIFFSNLPTDVIEFSSTQTGFFGLENLTDKCLIFSAHAIQRVNASLIALDEQDQLFLYRNWTDFSSISGNDTIQITSPDDTSGVIVRIVTDEQLPPISVTIAMQSDADMPRFFRREVYTLKLDPQECPPSPVWYTKGVATTILVLTCVFGVIALGMLLLECLCGTYATKEKRSDRLRTLDRPLLGSEMGLISMGI
jgi:hypothetical protein